MSALCLSGDGKELLQPWTQLDLSSGSVVDVLAYKCLREPPNYFRVLGERSIENPMCPNCLSVCFLWCEGRTDASGGKR